jgi:hypothetical protein
MIDGNDYINSKVYDTMKSTYICPWDFFKSNLLVSGKMCHIASAGIFQELWYKIQISLSLSLLFFYGRLIPQ